MERKLLICREKNDLSDPLRRKLSRFGFSLTTVTDGDLDKTESELRQCRYDVVFIFVSGEPEDYYRPIERIVREHPDTKVYMAVYRQMPEVIERLISAGAHRCFVMPVSLSDICRAIVEDHTPFEEELVLGVIDDYLAGKKFPRHMEGYDLMCIALEKCIREPQSAHTPFEQIYPYTAEITLTKPEYVRRTIAELCRNAAAKGAGFIGCDSGMDLCPESVLTAAADEFRELYLS